MQLGTDTQIASSGAAASTVGTSRHTSGNSAFFGPDGLTWHDFVDAINPLEHIPIISNLFDSMTGHTPSTAAKLAGGALLGGPIGFIASLANVIFETQTGHDAGGAVLAALTGDEGGAPTTEYAANDVSVSDGAAPVDAVTVSDQVAASSGATASQQYASVVPASGASAVVGNQTVLDLYGGSAASAHKSYQKAQMLPYLRDVTTSQVL